MTRDDLYIAASAIIITIIASKYSSDSLEVFHYFSFLCEENPQFALLFLCSIIVIILSIAHIVYNFLKKEKGQ